MDLSAELEPSELLVQPGEMARAELRLRNRGDHPAALSLQVADVDVDWIWTNPTALKVAPGGEARVQVSLRPPRGADPPAGPMTVALRALPAGVLHQPVEATLTLEVAPVADLIASVRPRISSGRWRARHTVSVHNRGNVALHVGLAPASSGDVVVEMRPAAVEVDPGEVGEATLWVRGRWPRLLRPVERPVAVEVDAGTTATRVTATFVQGPVLRGWQRWVAVGLVVLGPVVLGLRALGPSGIPSEFVADDASGPANDDGSGAAVGAGDVPAVDPDCPARDHIAPDAAVRFLDRERTERDREAPLPRGYAFLAAADGCNPVRFDPCQPVHYVIGGDVSVETVNDAHEAVARTAEASGLRFVYDGTTEEDVRGRSPYQPERYGERWVPLLITFERRGTEPPRRPQDARRGDVAVVAGTGLPTALEDVIVTAQVSVNLNAIVDLDTGQTLPGGFGSGITRGRVLLHELGHAVGLGHVADRDHLMHEPLTDHPPGPARYAAGDRIGFRYVGRELGCLATPPLPDEPLPPPSGHPSGSVISPR